MQKGKFKLAPSKVNGVRATELWGDAMSLNLELRDDSFVLLHYTALPIIEHDLKKERFIESGGGFRLDFF